MSENQELIDTLKSLKDEDENMRSHAALSLGWIGEGDVIEPLAKALLNDLSAKVRANAAMSLGQVGDAEASSYLVYALEDKDANVRGMATYSLGLLKADKAINPLIALMYTDIDKEVRIAATDSLAEIGNALAVKPLVKTLIWDENSDVRKEASESIIKLVKLLDYPDIDKLIEAEKLAKEKKTAKVVVKPKEKVKEKIKIEVLDDRKLEVAELVMEKLPGMLDYAIHQERITFSNLCRQFDCDDQTLVYALKHLSDEKQIDVEILSTERSIIVNKPQAQLSPEAQDKIILIRRKFGINW
ncbi:MAG: HEAT repeat domain-containing protein [Candidatus Heimdallarchaeota archaeon]